MEAAHAWATAVFQLIEIFDLCANKPCTANLINAKFASDPSSYSYNAQWKIF